MARRVRTNSEPSRSPRPPATTPDGRETQLISLAVDMAERQLLDGTASAQVITHFLKLGSSRERLEQERLTSEVELMRIKQETLASEARTEALYKNALDAMRTYSGQIPDEVMDEYHD